MFYVLKKSGSGIFHHGRCFVNGIFTGNGCSLFSFFYTLSNAGTATRLI